MTRISRALVGVVAVCLAAARLEAQVTETPIAFDSAGRVRAVTPAVVTRLQLQPPAWPVAGQFRQARIFASSAGGHVLVVERLNGDFERHSLNDDQSATLRAAIDGAIGRTGALATEEGADVVSEPARGAFVRNQMLMTWTVYGPLLSFIAGDTRLAAAAYLLATGGSYFATNQVADREQVTRAQNHLTTDAAWRGSAIGAGTLYVLAGEEPDGKSFAGAALAGGLTSAVVGFRRGRGMTDAEAEATTTFSTLGAATAFFTMGAVGALSDSGPTRGVIAPVILTGVAGYTFGSRYAKRTSYGVTRGDVQLLKLGSGLGVMTALSPFVASTVDDKVVFGAITAGLLGGATLTHARWVRPYEHSAADAAQVTLGATAGGLLGTGAAVLFDASPQFTFSLVTVGAILGAVGGHGIADPPRAGTLRTSSVEAPHNTRLAAVQFHIDNLAFVAARQTGIYPVVTFRF